MGVSAEIISWTLLDTTLLGLKPKHRIGQTMTLKLDGPAKWSIIPIQASGTHLILTKRTDQKDTFAWHLGVAQNKTAGATQALVYFSIYRSGSIFWAALRSPSKSLTFSGLNGNYY